MWSDQPEKTGSALPQGEFLPQNAAMHSLTEWLRTTLGDESCRYLSPVVQLEQGIASQKIPETARQLPADLVAMARLAAVVFPV